MCQEGRLVRLYSDYPQRSYHNESKQCDLLDVNTSSVQHSMHAVFTIVYSMKEFEKNMYLSIKALFIL